MTQIIFVMEFFIVLVLTLFGSANPFSNDLAARSVEFTTPVEVDREVDFLVDITIVMDDMIAKVDSQDPSDVITGFRVYDLNNNQLLFEDNTCTSSVCNYDLSALSPATYYIEVDSNLGQEFRSNVAVQ